ncbi:hypothetical protein FNF27_05546 [Cafeteria roenbergensis]|uniref:DNA polymerase alpha/delta/epsilon subunit B domain-containing protein n=1 Tax=Cafeteria roenbergensis TaxID=33653 RepID=A0A5A8E610_CAFRO|nr:hypothetical protein FNF27_05546 [Cafeteria roenbergensis]
MSAVLDALFTGSSGHAGTSDLVRASASYAAMNQRFRIKHASFRQQFNQMYVSRIAKLRPRALAAARKAWGAVSESEASSRRGSPVVAEKIVRLRVGQERVVVGTVFKDMPSRPSVVEEFAGAYTTKALDTRIVVSSAEDTLSLEDESGRVVLTAPVGAPYAALPVGSFVTGVVMAARGVVLADGSLQVHGFCFPELVLPAALPAAHGRPHDSSSSQSQSQSSSSSPSLSGAAAGAAARPSSLVLLVSDLGYGEPKRTMARQMLWDFVAGASGAVISRVVVAGGLVAAKPIELGSKFLSGQEQEALAEPISEADAALSAIAPSVPFDVMPGANDPGTALLPQQPLHGVLLPLSQRYTSFRRGSNPHHFEVGGVSFLGHSGQPLDAVLANAEASVLPLDPSLLADTAAGGGGDDDADEEDDVEEDGEATGSCSSSSAGPAVPATAASSAGSTLPPGDAGAATEDAAAAASRDFAADLPDGSTPRLNALANCLRWQHLAPNTPDGLACYPFVSDDPFVVDPEDAPHVLFAGCQPTFGTTVVRPAGSAEGSQGVRVILVPSFAETGEAVLVDLATLEATSIAFSCDIGDDGATAPGRLAGVDEAARAQEKAVAGIRLRKTPTTARRAKAPAAALAGVGASKAAGAPGAEEEEDDDDAPPPNVEDVDEDDEADNDSFAGDEDDE